MRRLVFVLLILTTSLGWAEPLSLHEAVVTALANHPDLRVADSSVRAQQARLRGSTANWYPSFSATAGVRRSGASGQVGGQNIIRSGEQTSYSYGFAARQQLLDFGKTHHQVRSAELELLAARADLEDSAQTLALKVVESYFQALREAQSVEINQANLDNARVQLEQAQGFLEAGTRAKIEVTRAEADLANARVGLIQARNAHQKALVALGSAMGLAGPPERELVNQSLPSPDWQRAVVDRALAERPDLVAADARVMAGRSSVSAAAADYRPVLATSGGYNWNDDRFPPNQTSWNLGVTLEVPILNEPTLSAAVQLAEASLAAARGRRDSLELQIRQQVAEEQLNLEESRQRSEAAETARLAAEESFRLASERYRVGVGSSIEVSQAQRALVEARAQEVQARFDVQLALGRLYRAVGILGPDLLQQ
ncbi:MAG: TolC family protein [Candidatus Eremiobacteraeota bacterium]|nr:TolC family protein [Candidatus Eremiobacteraeota bacterium]